MATKKSKSRVRRAVKEAPSSTENQKLVEVPGSSAALKRQLAKLSDASQDEQERTDALRALQAASFTTHEFEAVRGEYIGALRQAAEDGSESLRRRALSILTRNKDPYAEKALVAGLRNDKKAKVPHAYALQLLSSNKHAGIFSVAREMLANSTDEAVREQAVRVLAADPDSEKTIQKILGDKNEPARVRQMCASALHALNPQALQTWAGKAVQDKTEQKDVVATSLTAMNYFGDGEKISANKPLTKRLSEMRSKSSGKVKQAAKAVTTKYGL